MPMRKPAFDRSVTRPASGTARTDDLESIRIVCGGLMLALVVLALRIADVWS